MGTAVIDAHDGFAFFGNNNAMSGISLNPSGPVGINTGTAGATNWLSIAGGMNVDANDDAVDFNWVTSNTNTGISFGLDSGEGMGSPRNDGAVNKYGLDFYTGFGRRLSITNGGFVGIGTASPVTALEVDGNITVGGIGTGIYFAGNPTPQTTPWTGSLGGQDYADSVAVSGERATYEPGDVMVIDPESPRHF